MLLSHNDKMLLRGHLGWVPDKFIGIRLWRVSLLTSIMATGKERKYVALSNRNDTTYSYRNKRKASAHFAVTIKADLTTAGKTWTDSGMKQLPLPGLFCRFWVNWYLTSWNLIQKKNVVELLVRQSTNNPVWACLEELSQSWLEQDFWRTLAWRCHTLVRIWVWDRSIGLWLWGVFQPNQGKKCLFAQLDRPTTNQSKVVCDVC